MLDLLLPQRCVACGDRAGALCGRCRAALPRLAGVVCARCGAPTAWPAARCRECAGRRIAFAQARAAVGYDRAVRAVVRAWKERGLRRLALLAAELVVEVVPRPVADAIAWVPPDRDRTLKRGHSTAQGLAAELARRWQLEPVPLLTRTRAVAPQRGLTRVERRRNVAASFGTSRPPPRRICLVDDVYTTGAMVSAAASALRRAGAREVSVVTFARALRSLDCE